MNPDLTNTTMAVAILQWFLELAKFHPVQFSVLFAVMSISGIVGAASLIVEPLLLMHNHFEAVEAAKPKAKSRDRTKLPPPPPPSKWRKLLKVLVGFLSVIARNPE